MVAEGDIHISPDYQRHFVWDGKRQSHLIESILLGIPVPSLYLATNSDSSWEVVDGLQRVSTLMNYLFMKDADGDPVVLSAPDGSNLEPFTELTLEGMTKIPSMNGTKFCDLPKNLRLNFLTRPIRITVLNDKSDYSVRFDLFERLNTGGIVLHEQEIRNCVYQGPFNEMIKRLAGDERFIRAIKRKDITTRGNLEELALKFFAYYEDRANFTHSVREFLNDYMERKTRNPNNIPRLEKIFDQVMDIVDRELPDGIVRGNRKNTTPLVLYEAIAVGLADLVDEGAVINGKKLRSALDNDELKKLTTGATNSSKRLLDRINFVSNFVR